MLNQRIPQIFTLSLNLLINIFVLERMYVQTIKKDTPANHY